MSSSHHTKGKRSFKNKPQKSEIYHNDSKSKNRYSIYYAPPKSNQYDDAIKSITKKSIQINNTQPVRNLNTVTHPSKPAYRKVSYIYKNATSNKRYDEEESSQIKNRASPYLKKQNLARTSILNRSNTKIKSGHLIKQLSPYQLYKQPRSSLSQHYDPTIQTSLHKRRQSLVDEKNQLLDLAKQYYKNNNFQKCSEILKKYLKTNYQARQSVQAHYLYGMSLINKTDFNLGIQQVLKVIQLNPTYKKSLYLILALAFKRLSKYDEAINILAKGLELYPDYYDCLVYRGKMYLKKFIYEQAKKDFAKAIQVNPTKGFAYLGKGTAQKELGQIQTAIQTFTKGTNTQLSSACRQKRGICYYQQGKLDKASDDLEKASLNSSTSSSTLHYYRGMIFFRLKRKIQALLCFEETLKCDNNKQAVTSAVQMMLRIKIQDKDFYEAYHIINRTQNIDVQNQTIRQWKLFLEASLFLMKKKYKQGIQLYQQLQLRPTFKHKFKDLKDQKSKERFQFLIPLIHLYKAFGYLAQNQLQKAELQYEYHTSVCKEMNAEGQNLSKKYNSLVMQASKHFPRNVTNLLQQAKQLIPTKPQPYLYLSFDLLKSLLADVQNNSKLHSLQKIIETLTQGISHLPQLSNNHISSFYFFRSIIYLYSNQFNKAVVDIDKAIQKSQDNIPKYFYVRGLIFAIFGNFSQAVQDLSVAINLDQKYPKPYLQRAKCLQIQGNSNQAFIDLQKYITLSPDDPYIHKYAGFLLFQNCAYQDCLSAFSHGSELPNDFQLILTKAKSYFLLGYYDESLKYFHQYQGISYSNQYESDAQLIKICKNINQNTGVEQLKAFKRQCEQIILNRSDEDCKIFKFRDIHQIIGSICLILKQYDQAIEQFQQTLNLFRIQKQKELQKNLVEDAQQFQDQWSEIQIKFNMSICYLCKQEYQHAYQMLQEFQSSSEKGKNWEVYIELLYKLSNKVLSQKQITLDTFQQNHRISKLWPKITLPNKKISLSMAFSYPFVEPPQMMPQFDLQLFQEFQMAKVQTKPEAPWINRNQTGLVFTPNIQVFDNLQLSMTTKKNDQQSQQNRATSQMQQSIQLSNSQFHLQTQQLKKKFKLDSLVEMKLNKMMNK